MLRVRDTVSIGSYGRYLQRQCEEMGSVYTKLLTDINSIRNGYQGVDAEAQIKTFTEVANKIVNVINNFYYYAEYMQKVADYDTDNLTKAKKQFDNLIADFNPEMITSNVEDFSPSTLNFNVDLNGGDQNV